MEKIFKIPFNGPGSIAEGVNSVFETARISKYNKIIHY